MKLVIGNKNYSSWSLRPWLVLSQCEVPFEEVLIPLDRPDTSERIGAWSHARRVPVLIDADVTVWDSLAICEYLAERFPERQLWPANRNDRALARSACAEMHSQFSALRSECPMKMRERLPTPELSDAAWADVARIRSLWDQMLSRSAGPFLFGDFSIADAYFAPVASRFRTYGLSHTAVSESWAMAVWDLPAMQRWDADAANEPMVMPRYDR